MTQTARILIVDDDPEILSLLEGVLQQNGMDVHTAVSAEHAEAALERSPTDLMVLDHMMPGEDGLSFCRRVRGTSHLPIIMLTAMAEDVDRIIGLELGADDYLAKPFNPRELVARIKTVLRRVSAPAAPETDTAQTALGFGPFRLYPERMALEREPNDTVHLTSGEFALLLALVERAPRVLSRDQLLDISRGAAANPFDRSIDSQISRLRKKIERDPRRPQYIKTVRNLGYAFAGAVTRAPG